MSLNHAQIHNCRFLKGNELFGLASSLRLDEKKSYHTVPKKSKHIPSIFGRTHR